MYSLILTGQVMLCLSNTPQKASHKWSPVPRVSSSYSWLGQLVFQTGERSTCQECSTDKQGRVLTDWYQPGFPSPSGAWMPPSVPDLLSTHFPKRLGPFKGISRSHHFCLFVSNIARRKHSGVQLLDNNFITYTSLAHSSPLSSIAPPP